MIFEILGWYAQSITAFWRSMGPNVWMIIAIICVFLMLRRRDRRRRRWRRAHRGRGCGCSCGCRCSCHGDVAENAGGDTAADVDQAGDA